jgi:hypothetical protein
MVYCLFEQLFFFKEVLLFFSSLKIGNSNESNIFIDRKECAADLIDLCILVLH